MPWFRVDDTLAWHYKTVAAGNAAMGLWVRAGAWSMQTLTDGFIPADIARQIGTAAQIERLTDPGVTDGTGLWTPKDGGYVFHEWDQRQPTRAKLMADREATANRVRNWRQRRQEEEDHPPDP